MKTLAVKFVTEENAKIFFEEFDKMKKFVLKEAKKTKEGDSETATTSTRTQACRWSRTGTWPLMIS